MHNIAKYRSIFNENFACPYIPPLKRAGFTDILIKYYTSIYIVFTPQTCVIPDGKCLN